MGSLICCHIKANQVRSQSLTSINISVNNHVFFLWEINPYSIATNYIGQKYNGPEYWDQ